MHKEKNDLNDFCWTQVQAKEIKPGNLITKLLAKTPRLISNVIVEDNVVTLFEKHGTHEHLYLKVTAEHKFDLLVHQSTKVPVTEGEVYE
jgi:hypothetical protein